MSYHSFSRILAHDSEALGWVAKCMGENQSLSCFRILCQSVIKPDNFYRLSPMYSSVTRETDQQFRKALAWSPHRNAGYTAYFHSDHSTLPDAKWEAYIPHAKNPS